MQAHVFTVAAVVHYCRSRQPLRMTSEQAQCMPKKLGRTSYLRVPAPGMR